MFYFLGILFTIGSYAKAESALQLSTSFFREIEKIRAAYREVRELAEVQATLKQGKEHFLNTQDRIGNPNLETTRFQHFYKGVEVVGSMALHHVSSKRTRIRNRIARFDLDTLPKIGEETAVGIARSAWNELDLREKPALKILSSPKDSRNSITRLVYRIALKGTEQQASREIIIDAHSGAMIADLSREEEIATIRVHTSERQGVQILPLGKKVRPNFPICPARNLETGKLKLRLGTSCKAIQKNQCQVLTGDRLASISPASCPTATPASDESAHRAETNSRSALQYFLEHHGRNSFDDRGGAAVSVVHAGLKLSNARWNLDENFMYYGDGDGEIFDDFTRSPSVAGHEFTHGVLSHTARLTSMGESGALNEAFADFFGLRIAAGKTWVIGNELFLDAPEGVGLRDLETPSLLSFNLHGELTPFPETLDQMLPIQFPCDDSNDRCWIHENATIPGHAFYLITQAIGPEKTDKLLYVVLTQGLTPVESFESAAQATKEMCSDLFDKESCGQVQKAFSEIGL